ncbi:hypothetical protein H6G54_18455 [Anabaena cylindrica FACHB-243]|uniref:Uncharacterized protein n=1 Tax=Anabaena cylindrica (strain ATCC 27899 / PCC 7122) TaxID=272123 RepID=K9ZA25_ANACC|nr:MULTISPECIES: hypothetical protein [Anabaena]AFZ56058.1 hypothetical protein Anacy_0459 [Anabaena cylindrica PCC 7122]MBD2419649.1 hypothetical protein [Anabaena cylindrica FACHB-243]MBY5284285.1 hypothetical protein [Anabaena sp. CCAP 1446/1C]MCM2408275.1 hypothetical protein [Anabaena sp. CCAP 1446/1C]BAY01513.1 hypothetical protein NIES19_07470 [Anabaena cylindrica PCC 7122]
MLNNISKFITSRQLKFPVVSVLITVGILGLGVVGEQTKINLKSSTVIAANLPSSQNQIQSGDKTPILARLREIRDQRSQLSANNTDSNDLESEILSKNIQTIPTKTRQIEGKSRVNFPERDGIYLYGQSSTPNQLGQGYIVFQKQQGKVIGALYMPSSEYSCFQGTIAKSGELAMTVTSSPGELGVMQVSTTSRIPRFSDEDAITYAYSVALQDYHQLDAVSANDREILQGCSQDVNGGNQ